MIFIRKKDPPNELIRWKENYVKDNRKSPLYEDLNKQRKLKRIIQKNLLEEQKGLCCYCCARLDIEHLDANNEPMCHIEHFYPRHLCKTHNKSRQTDYSNMFLSCNGTLPESSKYDLKFCGKKKDDWYDENYMISPLEENCEENFKYNSNGTMIGKNEKAMVFIEKLGLNSYALKEARKRVLKAIGYFDDSFDKEYALEFSYSEDEDGFLPDFCNIIRYFGLD